jgi:ABC-type nickel/cobalt efflux system permease component RcnA
MRLSAALLVAALAGLLALAWASGALQAVTWWAAQAQHTLQSALAGEIQRLRAGEPGALAALLALCFGYGFVHALGPGHGKVLITGAAVGMRASAARMAAIALAGSLAQAAVAVVLVYGTLLAIALPARDLVAVSERWLGPLSAGLIALIGIWLVVRGLRGLAVPRTPASQDSGHAHTHGPGCGHAHGPDPEAVARAESPRAMLALVAGMAARPCTGALVVLVLAWRFGLQGAGAAAVLAMGLGTAAFTVLVAVLAVTGREAAFLGAGGGRGGRLLAPVLQIAAGGVIVLASASLLAVGPAG